MEDEKKTREQLLDEVRELRRRLSTYPEHGIGGNCTELPLPASERELRAILEACTEAVFLLDPEANILMANKTTAELLKTDVDTLLRTNALKLVPPDVAELRRKYMRQVTDTGAPLRFEDERLGRNFLISIYPIKGESGQVTRLAVFGMDITEERRARQAIEESRRQLAELNNLLQLVLDTIPVRIFWKDLHSVYLGCNRLFARDAGRQEPHELIGDNDFALGWRAQADLYVHDDRQVMTSGTPKINYEEQISTLAGDLAWVRTTKVPLRDQEGRIFGLLGTYEDITEWKEMDERLRESEERYRNLFQNNHAVQLLIDPESGEIVDANPAACGYYGYDLETLRKKKITDINILTPEQVFAEMARAKAEQRKHFLFSHRLANGEIRPVEVFSGPVTMQQGKKLLYSIIHDISERKKVEEERERLIFELRDALAKIKTLKGLLPICASCKKIRDDQGYWSQIESYIRARSEAEFSHGICPECARKLYPELDGLK